MTGIFHIAGYAIVSTDGMIADAGGEMPDSLKHAADQAWLSAGLDQADLLVHGRGSHENQPESANRRRLIVTRQVGRTAPHPEDDRALLWNPAGVPLMAAAAELGVREGVAAIIGGTDIFGLFLRGLPWIGAGQDRSAGPEQDHDMRYDVFHLSRATCALLPGGRPVFPGIPPATPDELLAAAGLVPGPEQELDAAAGITLMTWRRERADDMERL